MKKSEVLNAWASILYGRKPSLSIEITRECPLRCPGCYAYEPEHLGAGGVTLRQLSDYKGDDLVRRLLAIAVRVATSALNIDLESFKKSISTSFIRSALSTAARHLGRIPRTNQAPLVRLKQLE